MTLDTVFDLASLTKVVGDDDGDDDADRRGRVRLNDTVASHIPGFERYGKGGITIRHLMTHVSGLRPDVDLHPWTGYDAAIELAKDEVPTSAPGEAFVYSDINFFLLGDIVARVTGQSLDAYLKARVFGPLGMTETGFLPPKSLLPRIAPTERCADQDAWPCKRPDAAPLRGVVHDPTARRMGGIAGHAGLFSTARDLKLLRAHAARQGPPRHHARDVGGTVTAMTSPQTPRGHDQRSRPRLGHRYDLLEQSRRSVSGRHVVRPHRIHRHELVDRSRVGFVRDLSLEPTASGRHRRRRRAARPRRHGRGRGDLERSDGTSANDRFCTTVRRTAVPNRRGASAFERSCDPVLTGIDVLARDGFKQLRGKTRRPDHQSHRPIARRHRHDRSAAQGARREARRALQPRARHPRRARRRRAGDEGREDRPADSLAVLQGGTGRPLEGSLAGIDTLVIDLQDIGVRFYTYQLAMGYVMEEAAKRKIAVVVLDRPNPINGWQIEGPLSREPGHGESPNTFIAYLPMPIRHGMTMGELARLYNEEQKIDADLTVIAMENWKRDDWYDETGLAWINPSPNMRNLNQATLYPGIGAIEYSNISVGRGTDQPFEQIGAPWIDGPQLAAALNARRLPGIRFYPITFTPTVEQVRERGMPGRVHGDHQSRGAAAGARRPRDRERVVFVVWRRSTSRTTCGG